MSDIDYDNTVAANLPPRIPAGVEIIRVKVMVTLPATVHIPVATELVDGVTEANIPMEDVRLALGNLRVSREAMQTAKIEVLDLRRMEL